jgi:hypothetical protein
MPGTGGAAARPDSVAGASAAGVARLLAEPTRPASPTAAPLDHGLRGQTDGLRTMARSSSGLVAGGVWRCRCVVVQQARQEPDQLVAFGLGRGASRSSWDGGDELVELS